MTEATEMESLKSIKNMIIMEDDPTVKRRITKSLKELGISVRSAKSAAHVVKFAKRGRARPHFMLDIHMGLNREHEGLEALEQLKRIDKDIIVGVISGYSREFKRRAERLQVDAFREKTTDPKQDVIWVVRQMALRQRQLAMADIEALTPFVEQEQRGEYHAEADGRDSDVNDDAFSELKSDRRWFSDHAGKYVAFVSGALVGEDEDGAALLDRLRREFPKQGALMTRVQDDDDIVDLPSPLLVMDD